MSDFYTNLMFSTLHVLVANNNLEGNLSSRRIVKNKKPHFMHQKLIVKPKQLIHNYNTTKNLKQQYKKVILAISTIYKLFFKKLEKFFTRFNFVIILKNRIN
eukprot:TRINITY_DN90062_c0_g1_i1.p2 TRINITY_DN90062_c0_g1~~TRINITY_DN90062_c0_g1_i1.p2  ORF type:complete len:102 (-),score=4.67 TRINITY_DN90062_c0_g1_i1:55-360(-)